MRFRFAPLSMGFVLFGCILPPEPDTTPPIFAVTFENELNDSESTVFSSVENPDFFSSQCWIAPEDTRNIRLTVVARDSGGVVRLSIMSGAEIGSDNIENTSEVKVLARDLAGLLAFENTTIENPVFVSGTTPDGVEIGDRTELTNMNFEVDESGLGTGEGMISRVVDLDVRYLIDLKRQPPSSEGQYKLRLVAEDASGNPSTWDTPYVYEPDSLVRADCSNGTIANRPELDDISFDEIPEEITSTRPGPQLSEEERNGVTSCRNVQEFFVCRANRAVDVCKFGDLGVKEDTTWQRVAVTTADGNEILLSPFCDANGTAFIPNCVGDTLAYTTTGTLLSPDNTCGGVRGSICRNGIPLAVIGGRVRSELSTQSTRCR